jgi:hypothetical protein
LSSPLYLLSLFSFLFDCFDVSALLYAANSINPDVYKALMKELAQTLETQFSGNAESRAAGMIINTMGWVEGLGFEVNIFFPNCNMPFG